jgi:tRNA(Ile)-lysidine synthase
VRRPADEEPFGPAELDDRFRWLASNYDESGRPGALVAVSGGSDSLGLLHLLKLWREGGGQSGGPLVAATVDHGLRPGSGDEARRVGALAVAWGFEHVLLVWRGAKPETGIQEAARAARYDLLAGEAERRDFANLVTAHTRDDQAETVLMRLLRGSGVKGLAGMSRASYRGRVLVHRPLLDVSRARLRRALQDAGVEWLDDPSNEDERFLRPRLRRLMPLLAAEGLDAERFDLLARKFGRADRALDVATANLLGRAAIVEDVVQTPNGTLVTRLDARRLADDIADPRARPATPAAGAQRRVTIEAEPYFAEAPEIQLRVLARALALSRPDAATPEDAALERLRAALVEVGMAWRRSVRRSLAGCIVSAGPKRIRIAAEPPRRARP